jgi:hypothetical protein
VSFPRTKVGCSSGVLGQTVGQSMGVGVLPMGRWGLIRRGDVSRSVVIPKVDMALCMAGEILEMVVSSCCDRRVATSPAKVPVLWRVQRWGECALVVWYLWWRRWSWERGIRPTHWPVGE